MVAEDLRAYRRRGGSGGSSLATSTVSDVVGVVVTVVGVVEIGGVTVGSPFSVSCSALTWESVTSSTSYRFTDARGALRSREGEIESGELFIRMLVSESNEPEVFLDGEQ